MNVPTQSGARRGWLGLLLAVLVAFVPSIGLTVCLGSDGHVDVGAGRFCPADLRANVALAVGEAAAEHSRIATEGTAPALAPALDGHGACVDLVVEGGQRTLTEGGAEVLAPDASDVPVAAPWVDFAGAHAWPATEGLGRGGPPPGAVTPPPPDVRGVLEHIRVVRLLI